MDGFSGVGLVVAAVVLASILAAGPLVLLSRTLIRWTAGRAHVRTFQRAFAIGLLAGGVVASLTAGLSFGPDAALTATALFLLFALGAMDTAWRWLPLPWVAALASSLTLLSWLEGRILEGALAAILTAAALRATQIFYRKARDAEFLGTGDVFLASALALYAGPFGISLVLGLASVSGLVTEVLIFRRFFSGSRRRYGVAFGTHLCLVFAFLWFFNTF